MEEVGAMLMFLICILNVIDTGSSIRITSRECGKNYNMDFYKSIIMTHSGTDLLYDNPCRLKFTTTSYKHYLCITSNDIKLDCETSLGYQKFLYLDPEVTMSCNNIINEEWCPDQYHSNVFIVIMKSSRQTSDDIKLRVYLKEVTEDQFPDSNSISTSIIVCIVISVCSLTALMITVCVILARTKSRHANVPRTHIAYQTTSGGIDVQTDQAHTNPIPASSSNQQQSMAYPPVPPDGLQGNYIIHPLTTACPTHQGEESMDQTVNSNQENLEKNYSTSENKLKGYKIGQNQLKH